LSFVNTTFTGTSSSGGGLRCSPAAESRPESHSSPLAVGTSFVHEPLSLAMFSALRPAGSFFLKGSSWNAYDLAPGSYVFIDFDTKKLYKWQKRKKRRQYTAPSSYFKTQRTDSTSCFYIENERNGGRLPKCFNVSQIKCIYFYSTRTTIQ